MSRLPLEEYFRYHPPTTQERQQKHEAINTAALQFAQVIDANVENEQCKQFAMFAIQQARMFGNQGATIDELSKLSEFEAERSRRVE